MRLKLQLFATNSIVDILKSQGKDSSYSARKNLAQQMGISNYSGTAEQNTAMAKMLSGAGALTQGVVSGLKTASNKGPTEGGANAIVGGVHSGAKAIVGAMQNTPNTAGTKTPTMQQGGNSIKGVDNATMASMTNQWQEPKSVTDAFAYTNQLLEKMSSGRTSYTDQIKDLMGKIQNRDKFSYDVDNDPLFQQALASAMGSGKTAMQDTIGQASALTGGYGSTYATTAGNQAYNSFIQDAYNNLPEYYNMALEAYQMEGDEMYRQLGMLSDADSTEYQRMYDAWNANHANAQSMYDRSYGEWQDSINNAFKIAQMKNSDYWNNAEMGYKYSALEQDQRQFDARMTADAISTRAKQEAEASELKAPSKTQMDDALRVRNEQGEEAYIDYLEQLDMMGIDVAEIDMHVEANRNVPWLEHAGATLKDTWKNLWD